MWLCCWKRKNRRTQNRSFVRSHQRLCAEDSGFVSVPVQRLAGPPIVRDLTSSGSVRGSVQDVGSVRGSVRDSVRDSVRSSVRGSVRDAGGVRGSVRDSVRGGVRGSVQDAGGVRATQITLDEPLGVGVRFSGDASARDSYRDLSARENPNYRNSPDRGRKCTQRPGDTSKSSGEAPGHCFTLSSSFEGLDVVTFGVHDSKLSSYDNLNAADEQEVDGFDRKQSLYDNVDNGDGQPLVERAARKAASDGGRLEQKSALVQQRRSSRTMPLRFTMFGGVRQASGCDSHSQDSVDQDYVNLEPLEPSRDERAAKPPEGAGGRPVAPERKKKLRRGSKTLALFCGRRPPILSKIEKQVLAYVPIYGEASPDSASGARALNDFDFPPPPRSPPTSHPPRDVSEPTSPTSLLSQVNPMYCPNTASTPGCHLDTSDPFNKPNAYFSF